MKKVCLIALLFSVAGSFAQVSPSGCYISGALVNQGPNGCGNSGNYCNLASIFVPAFSPTACGTNTSSGTSTMNLSSSFVLPSGCTATVTMEFKPRNYYGPSVAQNSTGCSNSGMDGGDGMSISNSGGTVASQGSTMQTSNSPTCAAYPSLGTYTTAIASLTTGCSNSSGTVGMVVNGGTCVLNGISNRADEIVTFTIEMSGTCGPSCSLVLPVELLEFSAQAAENRVELNWSVASETRLDHYTIERSRDAEHWSPLLSVKPSGGGRTYTFYRAADPAPLRGINYYRLSNVDLDGHRELKKVILVLYRQKESFLILQDDETLTLQHPGLPENSPLELYDSSGRLVKKIQSGAGQTQLSKSELIPGFYLIGSGLQPFPQLQKLLIY